MTEVRNRPTSDYPTADERWERLATVEPDRRVSLGKIGAWVLLAIPAWAVVLGLGWVVTR